jgi:hypothetical protein
MDTRQDPEIVHEVKALKSFRIHLSFYIIIIGILWLVWLMYGGMSIHAWPAYPTVVWGVILFIHYINAYRASKPEE